jgi:hypothetical protein
MSVATMAVTLGAASLADAASTPLATPVASYSASGAVLVSFTADGVASSYTVTSVSPDAGAHESTCSVAATATVPPGAQSCVVSGLTNGDYYVFTVSPSGVGTTSTTSLASVPLLASATWAPGAPTAVTATGGLGQIAVSWTAPTSTNGSPITGYTVVASGGDLAVSCGPAAGVTTTSCTITGLPEFVTTYQVSVSAVNASGTGTAGISSASTLAPVVPEATAVHGHAVAGKTETLTISGSGFSGAPTITSSAAGTTARVTKSTSNLLTVKVTANAATRNGTYDFAIHFAGGNTSKVHYVQG